MDAKGSLERRPRCRAFMLTLSFLVIGFIAYGPGVLYGAEQRCGELGVNCVCSEPLNTDTLNGPIQTYWLDPADSTSMECSIQGQPAIEANNGSGSQPTGDVTTGNSSGVLNALPAGHQVQHYLRGVEGHDNTFFIGQSGLGSQFMKRVAMRWYVYHSAVAQGDLNDFEFKGEGSCQNTKFSQHGAWIGDISSDGSLHIYNPGTWTYAQGTKQLTPGNCCWIGPPSGNAGFDYSDWRGVWWRVELIVTNRGGGASPNGSVWKMYMQNVTNGTPEMTVIDTQVIDPTAGPQTDWLGVDDLTPSSPVETFLTNNYRQAATGSSCSGFRAISHYMLAGWDTDEGQRIGPAYEIEGGTPAVKPNPPVLLEVN